LKNLHLDLVRVTEGAAIAASKWVGSGEKELADKFATEAMRKRLNRMDFSAIVSIGEGVKDNSFGIFRGEKLGILRDKEEDFCLAIDPIEGTTPTSKGGYEAMSVIALGKKNAFYQTDQFYMHKLAAGEELAQAARLSLSDPVHTTIEKAKIALQKQVTVCVLDRDRHDELVATLREMGCRVFLISDCDVSGCISTCMPESGIDLYMGIGGAPEAVITAAALKCMGGFFQAQACDRSGQAGAIADILGIERLVSGPTIFAATGITDGKLLKGVRYTSKGPVTHSLTMRSESGTIRKIETIHGN